MKFTPKTEEECQAEQLCPVGLQPFTILEASETKSQSDKNKGKDMIKLKLNVHGSDGFDYHIYDYIADWFMVHKFRHFFYAVGAGQQYEAGNVDVAHLVGRQGYCDIVHQRPKPGSKYTNVKEAVNDYTVKSEKATEPQKVEDDEIPF